MPIKMKIKPAWKIGLLVWLIYNAIIFGIWAAVGADYTDLAGQDVILERLVFPEVLGAIFIIGAVTRLGWWQSVLHEDRRGRPRWTMWIFLPLAAAFIVVNITGTDWSAISLQHLVFLLFACALVGFNEEVLIRGVVVVAARGSMRHEVLVWLFSTGLFGLMHIPNGFFGIGLSGGITQAVFTFLLGSGLYLLRRISGSLLLPVIVHASWDFSTFAHQVTSDGVFLLATFFQFLAYLAALVLVIVVLFRDRKGRAYSVPTESP